MDMHKIQTPITEKTHQQVQSSPPIHPGTLQEVAMLGEI
jgi:hypothetical protein